MFNFFKRTKRVKAPILSTVEFNKEILEDKKTALVTFSAAWCGACKMQKPLIHDIADAHKDTKLIIGFIDTDNESELSQSFQIQGIPTTIGFKEGEIVFRHSGLLSRRNLEQLVEKLTKTPQ